MPQPASVFTIAAAHNPASAQPLPLPSATNYAEYADANRWICLPGRDDVRSRDLKAIELFANGSSAPVPPQPPATSSTVDCFYVYPTVGLNLVPGNPDPYYMNRSAIEAATAAQAASSRKRMPGVRAAISAGDDRRLCPAARIRSADVHIAVATSDVLAAFDYYLANHNQGRKIVLIGHSQGSEMLIGMIQGRFESSPELRQKLLLAILAGIPVNVPTGQKVGGTFTNVPVCTQPGEIGCFIAFGSYAEGSDPTTDLARPDPGGPGTGLRQPGHPRRSRAFPRSTPERAKTLQGTLLMPAADSSGFVRDDAQTKSFTRLSGAYSGACTAATNTQMRFFSIREEMEPTDPRRGIVKLSKISLDWVTQLLIGDVGLHVLDMQFPMQDMVSLVAARRPPP